MPPAKPSAASAADSPSLPADGGGTMSVITSMPASARVAVAAASRMLES